MKTRIGMFKAALAVLLLSVVGASAETNISPGTVLKAGTVVRSQNGLFDLAMQGDGNLVLYLHGGEALFASSTAGRPGAWAVMQRDGNFVVYSSRNKPLWDSGTYNHPGAFAAVQNDGNFVVYGRSGGALWASRTNVIAAAYLAALPAGALLPGTVLKPGTIVKSQNGRYALVMQTDGNLVVYSSDGRPHFASNTAGKPGAYAVMQTDGNLVLYLHGRAIWASGTDHNPGAVAVMQNDGNFVIYHRSTPLWASQSGGLLGGQAPASVPGSIPGPVSSGGQPHTCAGTPVGPIIANAFARFGPAVVSWAECIAWAESSCGTDKACTGANDCGLFQIGYFSTYCGSDCAAGVMDDNANAIAAANMFQADGGWPWAADYPPNSSKCTAAP